MYYLMIMSFLIILLSFITPFISVPSSMQKAVDALVRNPQTATFLAQVQKEGPIRLQWEARGPGSNALWNGTDRIIVLNSSNEWTEGKKISSILFELHNASTDSHFLYL